MKKNPGFSITSILLVIVAIALLGMIGWRVYDAGKVKTSDTSNQTVASSRNNQSKTDTGSTTPAQPAPQPAATYLDIKEMGIKIKLDDKTGGDSYSYSVSTNSKGDG